MHAILSLLEEMWDLFEQTDGSYAPDPHILSGLQEWETHKTTVPGHSYMH